MDPAETHWQGHRIAAAASLHKGGCGAGRLESGQSTRGEGTHARRALWIPRRHIGKGPGQPSQLACTGRLWGSAQGDSSQNRAIEAREHTLAELWIPRRRIGKGTGQPPQLPSTRRLQGRRDSGLESGQSSRGEGTRSQSSGSRGDALARAQGQPPQLACTRRLQGRATQVETEH